MQRSRKKPIKDLLNREVEKPVLEEIYLEFSIATDQLRRAPQTLQKITDAFNRIASRDLDSNILLRYMINRRKAKDWPRLETKAKKLDSVLNKLNASQLEELKQIYLDLDETSDELLFQPDLMRKISMQFEGRTGTKIDAPILIAVIIAKRKRGLWVKIREPFADIEAIIGA
ncbi:MAG: hypothetical protein KAV87_43785 [Desulfobacteraceae bacterium]|nr:hypothetical protein [Desulfobacteraceae bacterium]